MKKVLFISISFILIAVTILFVYIYFEETEIGEFDLSDYEYCIKEFPIDKNVGDASDPKELIKKSKEIWIEIYGKSVIWERPYKVFYDSNNDVWLIHGSLPSFMAGGVAYILVEKDTGNVLAVWHDK